METAVVARLFSIGDLVPQSGSYLCVPCGYVQFFEAGAKFIECLACLAGTSDGPAGFQNQEAEFWQYLG